MNKITIEFPDDCTEQEAITYASGCFNQHQLDYKRIAEGFRQGVGFTFGDGRDGYLYRTMQGSFVLNLKQKTEVVS